MFLAKIGCLRVYQVWVRGREKPNVLEQEHFVSTRRCINIGHGSTDTANYAQTSSKPINGQEKERVSNLKVYKRHGPSAK
jgi:hypothetical protein